MTNVHDKDTLVSNKMFPPQKLVFPGKAIFPVFKPKIEGRKNSLRWIHILLRGGLHLELVHSGLGLGNVELVAVLAGHNDFLLFLQLFCFTDCKGSCALGIARVVWLKENRICRFSVGKFFSVHSHRKRNLTIVFLSTIIYDKSCRIRRYLSYDLSR